LDPKCAHDTYSPPDSSTEQRVVTSVCPYPRLCVRTAGTRLGHDQPASVVTTHTTNTVTTVGAGCAFVVVAVCMAQPECCQWVPHTASARAHIGHHHTAPCQRCTSTHTRTPAARVHMRTPSLAATAALVPHVCVLTGHLTCTTNNGENCAPRLAVRTPCSGGHMHSHRCRRMRAPMHNA
jgi:hypothetical protein